MTEKKKKIAIYPGTFDPVTNGHIDLVLRAKDIFDKVFVSIGINRSYSGLLVDHAHSKGAVALIRGLRALSDFEYEFQLALMNRKLAEEISTVFLMPHEKYTYVNSSLIRNLAQLGQDVSDFVPASVQEALKRKFFK
ncbi:MAG: pantetheine-phosphate adenylyltransferase [Chlorobiota bacterium]|nr:MAG: pantetheine-phosphate adenylyltransferase [Chlorobiota bacterium]